MVLPHTRDETDTDRKTRSRERKGEVHALRNHINGPRSELASPPGAVRLRPMLLTTLAIALRTWIMVPDPVFGGLAIAITFGAMSSAVFSLFLLPLLYWRLLASSGGVAR